MAKTPGKRGSRAKAKAAHAAADSIRLHLYCHGLGDCLLLEIPRHGGVPFWMLIDCGIHTSAQGGADKIRTVVADIYKITRRLDVIVGTHEHWDHISGFTQAEDLFRQFSVGEVWFAWTENPEDPQGRRLDKFKGDAADALAGASMRLGAAPGGAAAAADLEPLLGFVFGLKGELSRDAREKLRALAPAHVRHLEPGSLVPLPADLDAVRVYVLGPPRDEKLLGVTDSPTDTYKFGIDGAPLLAAVRNSLAIGDNRLGVSDDPLAPFEPWTGRRLSEIFADPAGLDDADRDFLSAHYAGDAILPDYRGTDDRPRKDQAWRRIDNIWLGAASDLALQLDSRTNNSSLVLAIEIVATGRVLIFAADAQVGNWRSWKDVTFPAVPGAPHGAQPVTGADLMGRTIFYKVGHHGSRNATLSKDGLELMTDPDLVAFVPTDEVMARKVRWSDIPATRLLAELRAKTGGRLIQSDQPWLQVAGTPPVVTRGGALREDPTVDPGLKVTLEIG